MKKLVMIFIIVMVVVLGLFFWSVNRDEKETRESGTLVRRMAEREQTNVRI